MQGNVWKWTEDTWGNLHSGAVTDPLNTTAGSYRVLRGGGRSFDARFLRSALRSYGVAGSRFDLVGFRSVRVAN